MSSRRAWPLGLAVLALALAPVAAAAAGFDGRPFAAFPPDSAFDEFFDDFADSTDRYFGITAAPVDTAGLDSALAFGLAHPGRPMARRAALALSLSPWLAFNRVDGPVYGGKVGIGRPRLLGELEARAAYAVGPNEWLGGGAYEKRWGRARDPVWWKFDASGGRFTYPMDRDRSDLILAWSRALITGSDHQRYLRRDGVRGTLERETPTWRVSAGYRDELESPLAVTTTWNLLDNEPTVLDNLPARFGRAHEFQFHGTVRLPRLPGFAQIDHFTSSEKLGSDFEYRRTRVAAGVEIPVGRVMSIVQQVEYGRLTGTFTEQAAFYMGGSRSLRTLESGSRGGTGKALARLDLIGAPEAFGTGAVAPSPALAFQLGAFAAIGSIWGQDPYGLASSPEQDWPDAREWLSEAGLSLLYRPGLPDPTGFVHVDLAWPVGPKNDRDMQVSIYYARPLYLVKPISR